MATLISAHQISKTFASKTLFKNISFALDEHERIGLIGPNGAGKSTLLSLISKANTPDTGQLSFANHLRLAYLEQSPHLNVELNIYETLMNVTDDIYDSDNIQLAYELISKLNLDVLPGGVEKKVSELSGGWKKKVALAAQLMKKPNLLLLDEPTNHLDLESILWLEDSLAKWQDLCVLMVTHDRRFLQNTCRIIFELNPMLPNGLLRTNGNYSSHIESKMILLDGQKKLEEKKRNTMMREKEWLARGPQARLTKQKARIERAHELIENVAELENKNTKRTIDIDMGHVAKSPKKLIEAQNITKAYNGQILFQNFSTLIGPKQRYGLIGANGCGKSTLLKCLIGQISADSGLVKINEDIDISYFEQGKDQLDLYQSVIKLICPEGDYVHFQEQPVFARSYLSRFYFRPEQMDMPAHRLSGGELSRLILAKLMLKKAHVLILDEPTNDLDVETLEALSDCLEDFKGAVLLVSHDRYFMDQNCDSIWAIDPLTKEIIQFSGTEQWEEWHKQNLKELKKASENKSSKKNTERQGLGYKEKLELESMESKIKNEELLLAGLKESLNSSDIQADFSKLTEVSQKISDLEIKIEKMFMRWDELNQKNGG